MVGKGTALVLYTTLTWRLNPRGADEGCGRSHRQHCGYDPGADFDEAFCWGDTSLNGEWADAEYPVCKQAMWTHQATAILRTNENDTLVPYSIDASGWLFHKQSRFEKG